MHGNVTLQSRLSSILTMIHLPLLICQHFEVRIDLPSWLWKIGALKVLVETESQVERWIIQNENYKANGKQEQINHRAVK